MIGKKILNYEVKSLLGEGGMGNVYLGEHSQLGRKVAIKMLHPKLASNSLLRERFKNEASAMALLQHPNIVALYDYMENDDGLFLIMEYVEGQELDDYIKNVTGPIPEKEIEKIMAQTLGAFQYAHSKGIVHRDIKPSNILLTNEGEVKVLDFGIAKLLDADKNLTKTGTQMGTVLYMSPEQVKGENIDQRSDIYALGVTLFQMATGRTPYASDTTEFEIYNQIVKDPLPNASSVYPGVSGKIDAIIKKATEKDLNKRYQSCDEFQADFKNIAQAVQKKTIPISSPKAIKPAVKKQEPKKAETIEPKEKKNGKMLGLVLLIFGVLGGGYLLVDNFILNGNESEEATTESEGITEQSVYVLSGELNFRSDKNVDASIIEALTFGERIELIGNPENPVYEEDLKIVWQKARWQGKSGWIAKTIDDQDVVGDVETFEDFNKLFADEYSEDSGYGEMKVWAYYALIEYMKEQEWLGYYTIRNDDIETREDGLKTVLRFKQNLNEKDKDDHYDFITLLESSDEKIVIYLRANSKNSGDVVDWKQVPSNVNYLVKKRKGEEYAASGNYGVEMREMNETWIAAADNEGALTKWLVPSESSLDVETLRFLESKIALDILSNNFGGYNFVSENAWYDFNNGSSYSIAPTYWLVNKNPYSDEFTAEQYINSYGQMVFNRQITSEWQEIRYVTDDFQKAKLLIDTDMNKLILYLRDDSGNQITWYGCIQQSIIQEYLMNREDYVEEEYYGC